ILMFVILYKYDFSLAYTNIMMVNSLFFTISVVTMAVFISSLISNENTISGIMQVVSLGSSFLCGAFVPQVLLSKTALTLGKIFPSYYYIKNNEMLLENPSFATILPNIGIMLAFSLFFIIISGLMKTKVNDKIS
ncbi:MAG: ABC transporter permease, partial [Peptoniphilus grossensis]